MRKAKLWFLAAVLTCGTMTVTTSCEQLLKATVDVVEAVKMTGVWEVTESPANSLGFHKGTTWTFDSNLTYTVSSGASGIMLIALLHENEGNDKMRGHLGTMLLQKCDDRFSVTIRIVCFLMSEYRYAVISLYRYS